MTASKAFGHSSAQGAAAVSRWCASNKGLVALSASIGSYSLMHYYYHGGIPQDHARWRRVEALHDSEHCPMHAPKGAPFVSRFEYVTTPAGDIVQTCVFHPRASFLRSARGARRTHGAKDKATAKAEMRTGVSEGGGGGRLHRARSEGDGLMDEESAARECDGDGQQHCAAEHRQDGSDGEVPAVRGIIYFCHGYGSSISGNVYWHLCQLASTMEGYGIISVEYPSHGRSDGLFVYISSWNNLVDSVESVYHDLRERYWPASTRRAHRIPTFLLGCSMGGAVALYMAQRMEHRRLERLRSAAAPTGKVQFASDLKEDDSGQEQGADNGEEEEEEDVDALRGVILQAPMCHVSESQRLHPLVERVFTVLAYFLPTFPITPNPDGDENGGDWSYYATHNGEVTRWLQQSPLYYSRKHRLGTAINLLRVTENIGESAHALLPDRSVALLVQHGSLDHITDPNHSKHLFQSCASRDKTLIIYQNQFHKLFLEPEFRRVVFDDIEHWLYLRTGGRQRAPHKPRRANRYIFRRSLNT